MSSSESLILEASTSESSFSSDIRGVGYGSSHIWKHLGAAQVGSAPPSLKYSRYKCEQCGDYFEHFYDLCPDIFMAIKRSNIRDLCPPK